jgi:hypothetical protein
MLICCSLPWPAGYWVLATMVGIRPSPVKGQPKVHAHVVVGTATGTAHGGHLLEAHVWPTLEVVVVESPQHLRRTMDEETGLALIQLEAAGNLQA